MCVKNRTWIDSIFLALALLSGFALFTGQSAFAQYDQLNLVADTTGSAMHLDRNLVNAWGLAFFPGAPFWVNDGGKGVSTLYGPLGSAVPLVVHIPGARGTSGPSTPTGIVTNSTPGFVVSANGQSGASLFIFCTLDGTISGWSPGVNLTGAVRVVDNSKSGAAYTGLATGSVGSQSFLYAADQANNRVDVFDSDFELVKSFYDPDLPKGLAAFNVQNIGGKLYVTFGGFFSGAPGGAVDVFDTNGNLLSRVHTGGPLNLPWGIAVAPGNFGEFSKALLVGNLGDGRINAFDASSGAFLGPLRHAGKPISIDGLWAIAFGTGGGGNGERNQLFFTAGPSFYAHGLFGMLTAEKANDLNEPIIPDLSAAPTHAVSTVPSNGDVNPYGVAFVPADYKGGGALEPGQVLVSNFNNSSNTQGTGTTIVRAPRFGGTASLFFQGNAGLGLTTALGVLKDGLVLVGNVPTTDGSCKTIHQGSLLVLDNKGHQVAALADSKLLNGPWDLTIHDQGTRAQVFVSDVLSGTVTRLDLTIPLADPDDFVVTQALQIASGYKHRCDPAALVVGPTGLAYDAGKDILYVASTADNAIYAIPGAIHTQTDNGTGEVIFKDARYLHGPLALVRAPNGDLIASQGDAVHADPNQVSEIVEFTTAGQFVAEFSVNSSGAGGAFGIGLFTSGSTVRFAAVDDILNQLDIWDLD